MRSNDSFNFPLGLIKYIVTVIVVIVIDAIQLATSNAMQFAGIICGFQLYTEDHKLFQQIVSSHQDTPKHIIVNRDDKERDRKISKGKGPFGDGCRLQRE